jgi:low temperature requirement protein LtrA
VPAEQRVSWSELFFDLIWVFAVTQVSDTMAHADTATAAYGALLLLLPLWWGWVGATLLVDAAGGTADRAAGWLVLFAAAACGLVMAVAVPRAYAADGWLFAAGYAGLRVLLWLASRALPAAGGLVDPYAIGAFASAPLVLAGAVLPGGWRLVAWSAAALIDLAAPRLLGARSPGLTFETAHLPERFGLFLIIALGESVVAVGGQAAAGRRDAGTLATFGLAFVVTVLLWWLYFPRGAPAARHSLEVSPRQARIVREVFSYGHLVYVVGIILVAVGLQKLIAHPGARPNTPPELVLAPGVAVYLLGFGYARWRMFGAATVQRFAAALACICVALAAPALPLVGTALLLTALLTALNGYESWLAATGRPLPLLTRTHRQG